MLINKERRCFFFTNFSGAPSLIRTSFLCVELPPAAAVAVPAALKNRLEQLSDDWGVARRKKNTFPFTSGRPAHDTVHLINAN